MSRAQFKMLPGDSLIAGVGLPAGTSILRNGRVVGKDARFQAPEKFAPVTELFQAPREASYSKYLAQIVSLIGSLDLYSDHQKDLSKRDDGKLQTALSIAHDALTFGHEPKATALEEQNHRLRIYYRKALLEYNLYKSDASKAILTANSALNEIENFDLSGLTSEKVQLDIFQNYKTNIEKQRELYLSGIDLDVDKTIEQALSLSKSGKVTGAIEMLDAAFFDKLEIQNRELAFGPQIALLNELVGLSVKTQSFTEAQGYIDYAVDIIESLPNDSGILSEKKNKTLEKLAVNVSRSFRPENLFKAVKILESVQSKFPNNYSLKSITENLKERENSPALYLGVAQDLKASGEPEKADDLVLTQAYRFKEFISSDNYALNLWLAKAKAEFRRFMPQNLVATLKTLNDRRGFARLDASKAQGAENRVKQLYNSYAIGDHMVTLDQARKLRESIKKDSEKKYLREHLFWLEAQSLFSQSLRVGNELRESIRDEFPNSEILQDLIS